jgi:protease I
MGNKLENIQVAALATNGFEDSELVKPKQVLESEGADVKIVSDHDEIKSWKNRDWNGTYQVDFLVQNVKAGDFDMLLLPGGVINPDRLRRNKDAVDFVKAFFANDKVVAAICHGPQMMIEAGVVKGRTLTSFMSIRKDLENAGANWIDTDAAVDGQLITSRNPGDIEAFCREIIQKFKK